jgi:hypothetical protein
MESHDLAPAHQDVLAFVIGEQSRKQLRELPGVAVDFRHLAFACHVIALPGLTADSP